jgi:beta-N-acetylhexosaminidase
MTISAFISGCAATSLSSAETIFFAKSNPWGLILFKRNCESPDQIKALTAQFRGAVDRKDAPVFIDQEGGRVQRLGPPSNYWRQYPPAQAYGKLYERCATLALRTTRNVGRLMAEDMADIGISASCLPVLDVPQPGAHDVIGNRAYSNNIAHVMALSRIHTVGLMEGGILPVMKHIPGHGRSMVDSHKDLPIVKAKRAELELVDFLPFVAFADCPMAMTAHVIYEALDAENPATLSRRVIRDVIRKLMNFQGLLMTDDLSMKALGGTFAEKSRRALDAGCDMLLHCNGILGEMEEVAAAAGPLNGKAMRRAKLALKAKRKPLPYDKKAALKDLEAILTA